MLQFVSEFGSFALILAFGIYIGLRIARARAEAEFEEVQARRNRRQAVSPRASG